jgi:hypothetical protein
VSEDKNGADLEVSFVGQKVNLKNIKSLNTLATVATLILVCTGGAYGYSHVQDTREGNRELVTALKDMTQAAREQNCLMRFDTKDRQENADFCRRISR